MTKKRIVESTNFKKVQQFAALSKAARSGDIETIANLARQGADLDHTDYDGQIFWLLTKYTSALSLFLICPIPISPQNLGCPCMFLNLCTPILLHLTHLIHRAHCDAYGVLRGPIQGC